VKRTIRSLSWYPACTKRSANCSLPLPGAIQKGFSEGIPHPLKMPISYFKEAQSFWPILTFESDYLLYRGSSPEVPRPTPEETSP
jgi:hypothetical protein